MKKEIIPQNISNAFGIFMDDLINYSQNVKKGENVFSTAKIITDKIIDYIKWTIENQDKIKYYDFNMLVFSRLIISYMTKYGQREIEENEFELDRIDKNFILISVATCLNELAFGDGYDVLIKDCTLINQYFISCFNCPKYSNELLKDFFKLCYDEKFNCIYVVLYSYEYISNIKSVKGKKPQDVSINDLYEKNENINDILNKTISFYPSFISIIHYCKNDDERMELWKRYMDLKFFSDIHLMIKEHLSNIDVFFFKYRNGREILINDVYFEKSSKLKTYILQFLQHHKIVETEDELLKENIILKIEKLYKQIKSDKEMELGSIIPYKHMIYQFIYNKKIDSFDSFLETFDWYIRLFNIMLIHLSCFASLFFVEGNDDVFKLESQIYDEIKDKYGKLEVADNIHMSEISVFMDEMLN